MYTDDNEYIGEEVQSGQTVEIAEAKEEIYAGLPIDSLLKIMPIEAGQQFGVSTGNIIRVDRAYLMFYKTQQAQFGSDEDELEEVQTDGTVATFDERVDLPQSPDRKNYLVIKGKGVHLMSILGATLRGVSYDG